MAAIEVPRVPQSALREAEHRLGAAHRILSEAVANRWDITALTTDAIERLCARAVAHLRGPEMTDAQWEDLANLYATHGDPEAPWNAAVIHAAQEYAENDILDHQGRLP